MSKRGKKSKLTPEQLAEAERMFCETDMGFLKISKALGVGPPQYFFYLAKRLGWRRREGCQNLVQPGAVEERLFTAAWLRWAEPKPQVERVTRVARGSCPVPAGGFRLGVGR